ncbi:MAG: chromosomal replication initiator protein DnaA [bacterium]
MKTLSADTKEQIYRELTALLPAEDITSWFKSLEFVSAGDGIVEIPLPNAYYRDWYEKHYREPISTALDKVLGTKMQLVFKMTADYQGNLFLPAPPHQGGASETVPADIPKDTRPRGEEKTVASVLPAHRQAGKNGVKEVSSPTLNPKYTFENFVVGPCNRLAHAWTIAVAENPGRSYNPLFIHGQVGLGKTHLLQAACHSILAKHPNLNIFYLSGEGFVNNYISAAKSGNYEKFRGQYRAVDVLVIDDIHFLGRGEKQASQEEFFHTFNALHNAQKQIILSSDSPPQDIPNLEERLVSRFKWGMVAPLDPPTFETRMAILQRLAEWFNKSVPDDVYNFIASTIDTNIRDLEGALKNVVGYAEVMNKPLDIALAQESLKGLIGLSTYPLTISDIHESVSKYFNIKLSDLQSKKRVKSISIPRQIGIYLARSLTSLSLEEIGASFGGKDHTTVMYSVEKIKQRLHKDPQFKATIDLLINNLKHRG